MGKAGFGDIYVSAASALGHRPQIKLSSFCDDYYDYANYAGFIIYHTYGRHSWRQHNNQGLAGGYRGQSFYVLILCTDEWPEYALRAAGQGRVHDYLYNQYFNMDYGDGKTCCGGFSVMEGQIKHSSIWLNQQSGSVGNLSWDQDGSKYLSPIEAELVNLAVNTWSSSGPGALANIPDGLDSRARASEKSASGCTIS